MNIYKGFDQIRVELNRELGTGSSWGAYSYENLDVSLGQYGGVKTAIITRYLPSIGIEFTIGIQTQRDVEDIERVVNGKMSDKLKLSAMKKMFVEKINVHMGFDEWISLCEALAEFSKESGQESIKAKVREWLGV